MAGHPDSSGIPMHLHEKSWQGWLQETNAGDAVIKGNAEAHLTIEPDKNPNWWVDSLYAVHPKMQSRSGINVSQGKGAIYSRFCKQKLNTKSSTEAKLVWFNGSDPMDLSFSGIQGQYVTTTTIYQDNKSTILLAEKGKSSSSKRMHLLNVSYYFITDQIKKAIWNLHFALCNRCWPISSKILYMGAVFVCMSEKVPNLLTRVSAKIQRILLEDRKVSKNDIQSAGGCVLYKEPR